MKNEFDLKFFDIQYKEGIIELLSEYSDIDFIIVNDEIPGEYETEKLINDIYKINNKIKIILISKNEYKNVYGKLEKYNFGIIKEIINEKKSNKKIYKKCSDKKELDMSEKFLKEKFEERNTENKSLKKDINNKISKNKNLKSDNYLEDIKSYNQIYTKVNITSSNNNKRGKVISIIGANGVGKSVFSIMLSRKLVNKKIIIIDFDFFNESLHSILKVDKYSQKIKNNSTKGKININDFIINTSYENVDLISGLNIIFDYDKEKNSENINRVVKQLKRSYDIVIIDTSLQSFLDYTKKILEISDENIMISGANLLEVKKTKRLLQIYNEEWQISKNKIKLVFNKCTKNSIDNKTLKKIFYGYKIIGKIKLSDYYDIVINNSTQRVNTIEKEIKEIGEKIIKNNIHILM